jgi:hypothetical protein
MVIANRAAYRLRLAEMRQVIDGLGG